MPTPYDNHDGGFTRADYRIAADYNVDLDAPEQVRCDSCNKRFDAGKISDAGNCPTCAAEIHAQECVAFVQAPSLAICLSLMGAR
jgi:uncharacterized paraquat-inducible protein A